MKVAFVDVFRAVLRGANYNYTLITPPFDGLYQFDYGLRRAVTEDFDFADFGRQLLERMPEDTLVLTEDELGCFYGLLKVPDQPDAVHMMGPLIRGELSKTISKLVQEHYGVASADVLQHYYRSIPVTGEMEGLRMLEAVYSVAYPGRQLRWQEIRGFLPMPLYIPKVQSVAADNLSQMDSELLEERYVLEGRLLAAVRHADSNEAAAQLANLERFALPEVAASPLRNIKNHAVGVNATCKAAVARLQSIHPSYIERIHEAYAVRIEHLSSLSDMRRLVGQMVMDYCECVRNHSLAQYSPQVQRVVNYIHFHLAEDMSLKFFAQMCNISSSYLSNLFRVETGMTLTDYINRCRVDRAAMWLRLSDDTIAKIGERVGFLDENYFTRVFKRLKGMPPSVYRRSVGQLSEDTGLLEELYIQRLKNVKEDQP